MSNVHTANSEISKFFALRTRLIDDIVLLGVLPMIAACGLIYEYSLSHYAGIVLGKVETAIFIMIGIMIMSAGLGSLISNRFQCAYSTLAWIEITIVFVGLSAIFLIPGSIMLTDAIIAYGQIDATSSFYERITLIPVVVPYLIGFVMGFLIGIEMPLVVRIRESLNGQSSSRNAAIVYAADCIGIAAGTFIWAGFLGDLNVSTAASAAAVTNCVALLIFFTRYRHRIIKSKQLLSLVTLAMIIIGFILNNSSTFSHVEERVTSIHHSKYANSVIVKGDRENAKLIKASLTNEH